LATVAGGRSSPSRYTIRESTTNPRHTFDESKLQEFADFVPGHKIGLLFR
jgi:hypothetical protein